MTMTERLEREKLAWEKNARATAALLTEARARDGLLVAEGYCDEVGCAVREVTIRIKDHDHTLLSLTKKTGLRCPVCHGNLKLHWVQSFRQHAALEDREARCSVNRQRYERDHRTGDDGLVFVPASVSDDDTLPA
jgi:hypothetical protein